MKKIFQLIALGIVNIPNLLLAQNSTFTLEVKTIGMPSTAKAYLIYTSENQQKIDSVLIGNNNFLFTGPIKEPLAASLVINRNGSGLPNKRAAYSSFYLERGGIKVICNDSTGITAIKGGQVNMEFQELKNATLPYTDQVQRIISLYNKIPDSVRKQPNTDKQFGLRIDSINDAKKAIYVSFVKNHPNSVVSLAALSSYEGPVPDVLAIEPLFQSLSADIISTEAGKQFGDMIRKLRATMIGAIAPDFSMTDTAGKIISLNDFRGKYVLVDFWASWCGPCRAENPNVVEQYNAYKNKGFTIVGVSLDNVSGKDAWLKAIHNDHLAWTELSALKGWKNEAAKLYSVSAIPQNFLVDPNGKIVAKNVRGEDLQKILAEIFKNEH